MGYDAIRRSLDASRTPAPGMAGGVVEQPQGVTDAEKQAMRDAFEARFPKSPEFLRTDDGYVEKKLSAWSARDYNTQYGRWKAAWHASAAYASRSVTGALPAAVQQLMSIGCNSGIGESPHGAAWVDAIEEVRRYFALATPSPAQAEPAVRVMGEACANCHGSGVGMDGKACPFAPHKQVAYKLKPTGAAEGGEPTDAARLDWLEQHDGRFYNIDKMSAIVGKGFWPANTTGVFNRLRPAIDAAIRAAQKGGAK